MGTAKKEKRDRERQVVQQVLLVIGLKDKSGIRATMLQPAAMPPSVRSAGKFHMIAVLICGTSKFFA